MQGQILCESNSYSNFKWVSSGGSRGGGGGGSMSSKEPSLNNRKMGVAWLKVGMFQGKLKSACESSGSPPC